MKMLELRAKRKRMWDIVCDPRVSKEDREAARQEYERTIDEMIKLEYEQDLAIAKMSAAEWLEQTLEN